MISFHRDLEHLGDASRYWQGFETVATTDISRIKKGASLYAWSAIVWGSGERHSSNFEIAHFCALDFDTPEFSLSQAIENIFPDFAHIIGTTKSHQKEKVTKSGRVLPPCDRFRVVIPFEKPISDYRSYRYTMQYYIDRYGADTSCKDGARFFWPSPAVSANEDPEALKLDVIDAPPEKEERDYSVYRAERFIPRWIEGLLKFGCPDGTRNTTCFKIGIYLTKCGYQEDEITSLIMASPIPIGPEVRAEVAAAVANGAKVGREELKGGEEKNS